ncbi:MAG: hypothetical protein ACRDJ5_08740, partial [Actinomycetota bacterium]
LEWLTWRFPCRVLVVKRNPYNIISSWLNLGWRPLDIEAHPKANERLIEPHGLPPFPRGASDLAGVAWEVGLLTTVLDRWCAAHPEWLTIVHEDLCTAPLEGFRQLCEATGFVWNDVSDRYLQDSNATGSGYETKRVAAEEPERWRKRLTSPQAQEIKAVLSEFPRTTAPSPGASQAGEPLS